MYTGAPGTRDLSGRVAVVTGAGKGLGRAYALALAAHGAAVVVNNRRHPGESDEDASASQTVAAIAAAGGRAVANFADVSDRTSGEAMVAQANTVFGRIDIVVANAGIAQAALFHRLGIDEYLGIFETNFHGNLFLAHAAWRAMRAQNYGRIVLTASSAGFHGNAGLSAYAAAKAAVVGLARTLAVEGASNGICVNVVAPYATTQMTAGQMPERIAQRFSPEAVAPLVVWLASESCDVSGEVFVSGAGAYRREFAAETATFLGRQDALPEELARNVIRPLCALTGGRTFSDARASFAAFVDELGTD